MSHEDLPDKVTGVLRADGGALDQVFPGSTEKFVAAVVPVFRNLLDILDRFGEAEVRAKRSTGADGYGLGWQLLWDASNALLGAFTLFQRGYATETLAVTRGVLERVACALALFDNPDLIPRFMAGKLSDLSVRAIGPAGRVITQFAHTWGLLSELGAHVVKDNIGTSFVGLTKGDTTHELELAIGGNIPTSGPEAVAWTEMVLQLCTIAEQILAPAPEQIFFNPRRVRASFKRDAAHETM